MTRRKHSEILLGKNATDFLELLEGSPA